MTSTSLSAFPTAAEAASSSLSLDPRVWLARCESSLLAKRLGKWYSMIFETRVSPKTAVRIAHAQVVFCLFWLPVSLPTFVHVALAVWTVLAGGSAWMSFRAGGGRLR